MKSYTKTIDIPPSPQNLCFSTDQQRPLPAHFQTPPRGGKSSYCPPEQTSEVANTMCEVVGGGERGPMGARAVLTRLKLVFPRLLSCCLSIAHSDSRQLKFLFEDVLLLYQSWGNLRIVIDKDYHWYLMPSQKESHLACGEHQATNGLTHLFYYHRFFSGFQ